MRLNLKNCSDNDLVDLYIHKGDKQAYGEIFNRYFDYTFSFAYSRLGNSTYAEDITSEVFYLLLDVLKSFDESSKLRSFIIGIALNKIRQFWYEQSRKGEVSADFDLMSLDDFESSDEEDENDKPEYKTLRSILDKLPENYRMVLTERFINRKNIKETAASMNVSEENVSVLQNRALKKATEIGNEILNEK